MVSTLVAALSLTASIAVDVPYVPQTPGLCGGAAVAMVFRYWGDTHAGVQQFAPLVDRHKNGIREDVLIDAVTARGWEATRFAGTLELLEQHVTARQPIIVLLNERHDQYHYVVVTAVRDDGVVVHDPSWGPSRTIRHDEFSRRWAKASYWSLMIRPGAAPTPLARPERVERRASTASTACDALLDRAIADVQTRGLSEADAILGRVRAECPASAGPLRELAGVRFAQRRWTDAAALARDALALAPRDTYSLDLLGSSLFMLDDSDGALRAWNQIQKPQLDTIRITGLGHSRYESIAAAIGATDEGVLTASRFATMRRRLNELPDRTAASLRLRPDADGFARVDATIAEHSTIPRGTIDWAATGLGAAVDREVSASAPGFAGQGDLWSASWRWWANRPRVAMGLAAPGFAGLRGIWRVDASWETETFEVPLKGAAYAQQAPLKGAPYTEFVQSRAHGGIGVADWLTPNVRYTIGAGFDAWNRSPEPLAGHSKAASASFALERRWLRDRVTTALDATKWFPVTDDAGFFSIGARVAARSATPARWGYAATIGVQRVSDTAPMTLWPGAGDGHARAALLRAHPLLNDGIVDATGRSAFGRTLGSSSVEGQRWLARPSLARVGFAIFADAAQTWGRDLGVGEREDPSTGSMVRVDAGLGLRVKLPGSDRIFRVDVARGLNDRAAALTIGWLY